MRSTTLIQEDLAKARSLLANSRKRRDECYNEYKRLTALADTDAKVVDDLLHELGMAEAYEKAERERREREQRAREAAARAAAAAASAAATSAFKEGATVAHIAGCNSAPEIDFWRKDCARCARIRIVITLSRKTVARGSSAQEEAIATAKAAKLKAMWGLKRGEVIDAMYEPAYVAPPAPPPPPPTPDDPIPVYHPGSKPFGHRVRTNPTFGQRQSTKRGKQGGKVI